jgi:hypothetical protein
LKLLFPGGEGFFFQDWEDRRVCPLGQSQGAEDLSFVLKNWCGFQCFYRLNILQNPFK